MCSSDLLKLWRASRLYFRKNQIAVCKPISIEMLEPLVLNYNKRTKRTIQYLDVGDDNSENSEEEVQDVVDALKDRRDLQKKLVSKKTIRIGPDEPALGSPESCFKGFKFDQMSIDKHESTKKIKVVSNIGLDGTFGPDNGSNQVIASRQKLPSSQILNEIGEDFERKGGALKVKLFNKESRKYMNQTFSEFRSVSDAIAEYKMQQSGNISKTLSYTNVRNLACFLLLSNLGLSLFLSSIFKVDPDICMVDKSAIRIYIEESPDRTMEPLATFMISKYNEISTTMIHLEVGRFYKYSDQHAFDSLRATEEIICKETISINLDENTKQNVDFAIYLQNRQYTVLNSMMNILRNIVIILILIFNIYGVNKDTRTLILNPLDSLFKNVSYSHKVSLHQHRAVASGQPHDQRRHRPQAVHQRHQRSAGAHGSAQQIEQYTRHGLRTSGG